jgi:hypothetical protein
MLTVAEKKKDQELDIQFTRGVADAFGFDAHAIEQRQVKIGEWSFAFGFEVSARLQGAIAVAGEDDRQVFVVMAVAIANACTIDDHRVIEQGAIAIFGVLEILQEAGEFGSVVFVDFCNERKSAFVALVVREVVMRFIDADFGEGAI